MSSPAVNEDREREADRFSGPVDQVGEPVPDRTCDEQSRQRLFCSVSADRTPCTRALLVNGAGGLARLVTHAARGPLDRIYRLSSGSRSRSAIVVLLLPFFGNSVGNSYHG